MVRTTCRAAGIFALAAIFIASLCAQQTPSAPQPDPENALASRAWTVGTEFDVTPFILKGYYTSLFAGRNGWRARAVEATSNVPGFLVSSGFGNKRANATALLVDRFLGPRRNEMRGFWIGGGGEFWRSRISQQNVTGDTYYNTFDLTAGGGYAWMPSRHFYLNPWADVHMVAAGSTRIDVSGKIYNQPRWMAEPSLKIGFVF
jgi:hypothetical protein